LLKQISIFNLKIYINRPQILNFEASKSFERLKNFQNQLKNYLKTYIEQKIIQLREL